MVTLLLKGSNCSIVMVKAGTFFTSFETKKGHFSFDSFPIDNIERDKSEKTFKIPFLNTLKIGKIETESSY